MYENRKKNKSTFYFNFCEIFHLPVIRGFHYKHQMHHEKSSSKRWKAQKEINHFLIFPEFSDIFKNIIKLHIGCFLKDLNMQSGRLAVDTVFVGEPNHVISYYMNEMCCNIDKNMEIVKLLIDGTDVECPEIILTSEL